MAGRPNKLETDRAYRARAKARAAALGLSPSAALGKPRKGEQGKTAKGLDLRTAAGRQAAEAVAAAAGAVLPPLPGQTKLMRAKIGNTRAVQGLPTLIVRSIMSSKDTRRVQVLVNVRDPKTGARRTVQPWGKGAISVGTLKQLIRAAGGDLVRAIINAMGQAQAGTSDIDAFSQAAAGGAGAIESVTLLYA